MRNKILHLGSASIFIPPLVEIIAEIDDIKKHDFILLSAMSDEKLKHHKNVTIFKHNNIFAIMGYIKIIKNVYSSDKVILHGLNDPRLIIILSFLPFVGKKLYWIIWGADLYEKKFYSKNFKWRVKELFRIILIKKIKHMVTYIKGDYELACKWYGADAHYHECLMYPSNLYKEYTISGNQNDTFNIQVGNSADPANNHIEALRKIIPYKDENITINVPLSYGDQEHASKVIQYGQAWFGDKFKPLIELFPIEDYLKFLGTIDIVIFNHSFQQAMGNTITLLGLGKTVYLRSDTTQWQFFKEKGLIVGDVEKMHELKLLDVENNQKIIKQYFSKENFIGQLKDIFDGVPN